MNPETLKIGDIVRWKTDGVFGTVCPVKGYRDDLKTERYSEGHFSVHWEPHKQYESGLVSSYFNGESMIEFVSHSNGKKPKVIKWQMISK